MRDGWFTYGPKNEEFERAFARYLGVKKAVSVSSCTAALHVSLLASGVKAGDEVLVPSFTFVATANAVLHCNAKPVFVDIDLDTFTMDPEDARRKITNRTKAIIPVHYGGLPCDLASIMDLAAQNDLHVIEDAAQALGAEFDKKKAGSFGVGCFSFFSTKHITTGEGGMVATNDEEIAEEARKMSGHGIDTSTWARSYAKYPWQRLQNTAGFNFRMTNFQAALGMAQMKRLNKNLTSRIQKARAISKSLEEFGFIVPQVEPVGRKHSYYIYTARVIGKNRSMFMERLQKEKIGVSIHYDPPVHLQPFYVRLFGRISLPKTEELSRTIVTLPLYPTMTTKELEKLKEGIQAVCKGMAKP